MLGEDDDGLPDNYSLLRERLGSGTYYLRVNSYFGWPGNFQIKATGLPRN